MTRRWIQTQEELVKLMGIPKAQIARHATNASNAKVWTLKFGFFSELKTKVQLQVVLSNLKIKLGT
jgi:hypothetical protein